jgi:hypothetical protein
MNRKPDFIAELKYRTTGNAGDARQHFQVTIPK